MHPRAPGVLERRVFIVLAAAYALLALAAVPWAQLPGPQAPWIVAVSSAGIAIADLCTALLVGREFLRGGRVALLALACAYGYGAAMAVTQALAFPGALFAEPAFGGEQTPATVLLLWRLGMAALFVLAVVTAKQAPVPREAAPRMVRNALAMTLGAYGASLVASLVIDVPFVAAGRFTVWSFVPVAIYVALCAYALFRIFRTGLDGESLFLWLSMVLVASIADQVLATFSGGRYTLGWHLSQACAVVSACLLLVLWLGDLNTREDRTALRVAAGYGAGIVVMLAALLLRWFISPWLGPDVPYATVFGAVAIAVWAGGWRPASLAALAGFVVGTLFFLDEATPLRTSAVGKMLGSALYWGSCALIIGLGESLRGARDSYEAAERLFRASQEASLQGYALVSPICDESGAIRDFRWEYVNPRGAAMARAKPEELVGRSLRDTLPDSVTRGVIETFVQVLSSGEPSDRDQSYDRPDGDAWFRYIVVKVADRLQVSFFDISETKRLERQLRERARELARSDSQKNEFLAMLSHELRNPLAPILNGLTLLERQKDPRALAATREMMGRQIRNLRRLIDDLLDMSRIDRGKLELVRERVEIEVIVHNALETVQPAIDGKSQRLVVEHAGGGWYVDGDPTRLAQIVSNLVGNASKFTADGGRVEVRVDGAGQEVCVTVTDDGVGFTPGDEERIFDMFVQLEGGRAAGPGGLGLGLALARRLAQLHGGSLVAQSAGRGQGATFVLRLPATRVAPDTFADTVPISVKPTRRVIVVDDNADAADSLAQVLTLEGFDVRAYHDPVLALTGADEFMPDVAFLDLNMPGMTGIELGQRLRARPWGASLRLVAVTGMGQAADVAATRDAGFHAHVTKPAPARRIVALAGDPGD